MELVFSKRSIKEITKIANYIEEKFSLKDKTNFLNKLHLNFELILSNPETFLKSEKLNLRKCVVTKYTTIFYRVEKNTILIVSVFDTRQNPKRLKDNK